MFGVHPTTAHNWAQYAQSSWTDYLAAHSIDAEHSADPDRIQPVPATPNPGLVEEE